MQWKYAQLSLSDDNISITVHYTPSLIFWSSSSSVGSISSHPSGGGFLLLLIFGIITQYVNYFIEYLDNQISEKKHRMYYHRTCALGIVNIVSVCGWVVQDCILWRFYYKPYTNMPRGLYVKIGLYKYVQETLFSNILINTQLENKWWMIPPTHFIRHHRHRKRHTLNLSLIDWRLLSNSLASFLHCRLHLT